MDRQAETTRKGRTEASNLRDQIAVREGIRTWPTPQEDDSSNVHPNDKRSPTLVKAVDRLPTPTRRDWKGARKPETLKAKGRDERNSLPDAIEYQNGGQLNPDWVEWLMGWPIGWEALQPFEWGNWPSDDWWSVDPADIPSDLEQDITVPMPPKNKYTVELNITNWPTPRAIYGEHPGMKDASHLTGAVQIPSQGTIPRVATGIPNRVDRLKALGNGQVPLCVKVAWEILIKEVI